MSPGPKKRFNQNKYRKDKAAETRREEVHDLSENHDRNLTVDDHPKALNDELKEGTQNKETPSFKKYNKRKVVSNWNRYDEIPDAENEELRGADYEVALTCSSGIVSQFRFEEEKEWEDESLQIDASDFTSIDCSALAAALGCTPFHKRLDISEDVFMPDMVEEFYANATRQRNAYVPSKAAAGSSLSSSYSDSTSKSKLQNEVIPSIIESLTSCLNVKNESTANNKETEHVVKAAQKKEIDTELDFLLSLSEGSSKAYVPEKINTVLQGDSTPTSQTNSSKSPLAPSSTDINIDDWLDSIVED